MGQKLLVLVRHAESEGNLRTESERAEFNVSTHKYALRLNAAESRRK